MSAPRGRPRSFDDDATLNCVLDVFWKQGFLGTSLVDLCAATGLNKPSLYGAFGNKEALFLAALDRYNQLYVAPPIRAMEAEPDAKAALRLYLRAAIRRMAQPELPAGCLLMTNLAASGSDDLPDMIGARMKELAQASRQAIDARLRRAVAEGQFPQTADAKAFGDFIEATLFGIASMAQGGAAIAALDLVVDTAMQAWPRA